MASDTAYVCWAPNLSQTETQILDRSDERKGSVTSFLDNKFIFTAKANLLLPTEALRLYYVYRKTFNPCKYKVDTHLTWIISEL